jgi:pimeloyl-ACP methyl ester carboxylesterase
VTPSPRERLLAGLPVTERRLRLAGVETTVLEGGAGPPLVLLHGGIECGGAYWAPVVERLAEDHRVVVPDVPGLGESEPVAEPDSDAFVAWFPALLQAACDDCPTVIAHSLLGTLAARYAVGDSDSLRRLVIYGAPGIGPYRLPVALMILAIRFDLRPSEKNAERFHRFAFFDLDEAKRHDEGWLEAWSLYTRERARVPHVKHTMRRLIKTCTKQIPETELRRIEVPTSVVWESHDRFVPLTVAEWASARFGWPLRVIDAAGHVPHIERTEAFLNALHWRGRVRPRKFGFRRSSRLPGRPFPRRGPRSPSARRS